MMGSEVELREIRVFIVLSDELHFGRTAERLGITPSRVSQTIRILEARAGGRLFDRTSRRVSLTSLGEAMKATVTPAYDQLRQAFASIRETSIGLVGTVRIGMYTPINGGPHLVQIIRAFRDLYPACQVSVTDTGFGRDQLDWLRRDELDLLAMRLPIDDPETTVGPVLSREPRVLAVASDHPLAAKQTVDLEAIANYKVADIHTLSRTLMNAFIPPISPSGKRLQRVQVRTFDESLARVALGETVHPTVRSFLDHSNHPGITAIAINDLPPSETALIWLTAHTSTKITAFNDVATNVLQQAQTPPHTRLVEGLTA